MKKLIIAVAAICSATILNAAAVGWTNAGLGNYKGNAYDVFVIGQNGVESIAQITEILGAGGDISSYAFGSGTVANNGTANLLASSTSPQLGAGTYESFFVVFDSATPTEGSKYALVSGIANQTQTIADTTAKITFGTANQSTFYANADNWKSYGSVPEPTSGLLMLLGMAGLALRLKRA